MKSAANPAEYSEAGIPGYEIVLKDGGSTDGSLQKLDPEQSGLHVVTKPDRGIYDAMNQAVEEAKGRFCLFPNCGDWFMDEQVLADSMTGLPGTNRRAQSTLQFTMEMCTSV